MAELLYFKPAQRKINKITIDLDDSAAQTEIKRIYHKSSGDLHLYIIANNIKAGAATLNSVIDGTAKNVEDLYL